MSSRPQLIEALAAWGLAPDVVPLAGDASTRQYFRGRRGGESVIIMDCGQPLPEGGPAAFPFARWLAEYAALGIRVPALLGLDAPRGLVLLEDLGDELLQWRVERAGVEAGRPHYARAVEWVLRLAGEGTRRFRPDAHDSDDPLNPARLALEMDLFLVHAARQAVTPPAAALAPLLAARATLDAGATGATAEARRLLHALCHDVHGQGGEARAMVLCHRDYHARNLLLVPAPSGAGPEEVAVIDFQDTRRGPRAYDLVSLAFDPYVTLPASLIDDMVEAGRPAGVAPEAWQLEVDLAAGQRLVKAAGSYAWLGLARGRREYLQWLAPALARAHQRLASWRHRDALWQALADAGALGG